MFLENYFNSKNKEVYILAFLILISIFIRIPVIFIYGDEGLQNEWTLLVKNLINYGILSFSYQWSRYAFPNCF